MATSATATVAPTALSNDETCTTIVEPNELNEEKTSINESFDLINKKIISSFTSITVSEGAGFLANRPLGAGDNFISDENADPFLLLDELPWTYYNKGEFPGAPTHPHRGFDTVMYIKEGEGRHEDSMGNKGILKSGDVQWMTAGSGIIHDEGRNHPGGVLHGFQLWVNLPSKNKMDNPSYQQINGNNFKYIKLDIGIYCKTIVGRIPYINNNNNNDISNKSDNDKNEEKKEKESPIKPKAIVAYYDYNIEIGKKFVHKLTNEELELYDTIIVYVYNGGGYFNNGDNDDNNRILAQEKDRTIDRNKYKLPPNTLIFDGSKNGNCISFEAIKVNTTENDGVLNKIIIDKNGKNKGLNSNLPNPNKSSNLQFLLLMGKKLKEPIARRGPFVMNTWEELYQCFQDFRNGKLVKAKGKSSIF